MSKKNIPKENIDDEVENTNNVDNTNKEEILNFLSSGIDFVNEKLEYISTGSLILDILLGGGWLRGRIHLLKGRESVSKSRLMAAVCFIETVIHNNYVLVIDYEGTWTDDWLSSIFVDLNKILIVRPDIAEVAFDMVIKAINSGKVSSIIIDSIASMTTLEESEKSHEESTQAVLARQLSKFCRKAVSALNSIKIKKMNNKINAVVPTVFLVNQVRTNLHSRFNTEMLPGGQAQKNTATTILDLFRSSNIEDSEDGVVGFFINARTDKNKAGVPFRSTQFGLITNELGFLGHPAHSFYHGYDLFLLGKNFGIIKQSGAWYEIPNFGKFQGESNTIKSIIENLEIAESLLEKIRQAVKERTKKDFMFDMEILRRSLGK